MALIKCPECGREISDASDKCIYCGYPIKKNKNKSKNKIVKDGSISMYAQMEVDDRSLKSLAQNENEYLTKENKTEQTAEQTDLPDEKSKKKEGLFQKFFRMYGKKKGIIILIVAVIVIAGVIIVPSAISKANSLDRYEQRVYNVVSRYMTMLKDPDSLVLRGDAIFIEDDENDRIVIFRASGKNSFGGVVTDTPLYVGYTYVGDLDDEIDDISALKRENFTKAQTAYYSWILHGENLADEDGYSEACTVDMERIAKKIGCGYKDY